VKKSGGGRGATHPLQIEGVRSKQAILFVYNAMGSSEGAFESPVHTIAARIAFSTRSKEPAGAATDRASLQTRRRSGGTSNDRGRRFWRVCSLLISVDQALFIRERSSRSHKGENSRDRCSASSRDSRRSARETKGMGRGERRCNAACSPWLYVMLL
jgi:hypothetical protein